ncbi:MAG: hypothetical protein ABUK01_11965 [Leptospirales bacterium]
MKNFEYESNMQEWLSKEFHDNNCLGDLIINHEYLTQYTTDSNQKKRILESYKNSIKSLYINEVISENKNISLNSREILKPDFLLYALETESIVIVELKNIENSTREAGTEIGAYSSEIKSYIPFISDGDIVNVIISEYWPTLLRHYIFHEIFWLRKNIICLQPTTEEPEQMLKMVDIDIIATDDLLLKISDQHLGGYCICLYDMDLYKNPANKTKFDPYIRQMQAATLSMSKIGNLHNNHGFAFLWKDHSKNSLAPYIITVVNFAPFRTLERFLHTKDYSPNELSEKLIELVQEYNPTGHGQSLENISAHGEKFLKHFCTPRCEEFHLWSELKKIMNNRAEYISFYGWGLFDELYTKKLAEVMQNGNTTISFSDPDLGWEIINELIDDKYYYFDLMYYNMKEED